MDAQRYVHSWSGGKDSTSSIILDHTPDGYKWLCSRHREVYQAREEAERESKED